MLLGLDEGLLEAGELGGGEADHLGQERIALLLVGLAVLAVCALHGDEELSQLAVGGFLQDYGFCLWVGGWSGADCPV